MATPVGTARAEDPGLSGAREAAEAVPTESVRSSLQSMDYLRLYFLRTGRLYARLSHFFSNLKFSNLL